MDTKLKRRPDPKHVLQLSLYSDLLAGMQGVAPRFAHLELGDGSRASVRLSEVEAYARRVRASLERFVAERPATRSEPVQACGLCRWREHCSDEWEAEGHLSLVAGITGSQRRRLVAAGVERVEALSVRADRIPRMSDATLGSLRRQASLQVARRAGGPPAFELLRTDTGRGFDQLPPPDDGDVFYDIEGDPFHEGGLEYLHGFWLREDGEWTFKAIWAHDRVEEGRAAFEVVRFLAERFQEYPSARVYHYGHYKVAALRRLTAAHCVGEAMMDQLQRERRFVDLYRVVSDAIVVSEPGYSIKDLECFYMAKRDGDVKTAGASVVYYERWREHGGDELLEIIRDYNETDCVSTQLLRDWLVGSVRPPELAWPVSPDADASGLAAAATSDATVEVEREAMGSVRERLGDGAATLLGDLAGFHQREDRPVWWSIFDRLAGDGASLEDDTECLGGLVATGPAVRVTARSSERTYRYPAQDTKLRAGQRPCIRPAEGPEDVDVREIDPAVRTVTLRRSDAKGALPDTLDLLPPKPIGNRALREAVARNARALAAGGEGFAHLETLVLRRPPSFTEGFDLPRALASSDLVQTISAAAAAMDGTVLPIQGPPGCSKTHASAVSIVDLVRSGRRVAVSSGSHAAIANLLRAVAVRASAQGVPCPIARKGPPLGEVDQGVAVVSATDAPELGSAMVVGATAWHFAALEAPAFDHLFIDEAGQVSLANVVAMAAAARNLVLVGDPMQLGQPTRAIHPGLSGESCLNYLLGSERVVSPDRGIFMPVSRRMHPSVCDFVSRAVYEGRLSSDDAAGRQRLVLVNGVAVQGTHFRSVDHSGRSQVCPEEVEAIVARVGGLIGASFRDRAGAWRVLGEADVLVVAPYNAQVNALSAALPRGVRVGTVDRFQGQEAPLCLISMVTSGADEMPRDLEFLLGINRLNVAVSRAQILVEVFASPQLLELPCRSIRDMTLVNTMCLLAADAGAAGGMGG